MTNKPENHTQPSGPPKGASGSGRKAGNGMTNLMTVPQLAEYLQVSKAWIYERTNKSHPDHIPHIKVGQIVRFDKAAIDKYLLRNTV